MARKMVAEMVAPWESWLAGYSADMKVEKKVDVWGVTRVV